MTLEVSKAVAAPAMNPVGRGQAPGDACMPSTPWRVLSDGLGVEAAGATPASSLLPRLAAARLQGDPPADRLAQWVLDHGPQAALPLFERVLALGLDEVPEAPAPVKDFFHTLERIPDWVEPRRLMDGARACHLSGGIGLRLLRDVVLPGACLPPAARNPLFMADTLPGTAQRLVLETSHWWLNCTAPGGLSRFAAGFKSTVRARLTNALARQEAVRGGLEPDGLDRLEGPGRLPANQAELQAVYLGCSAGFLAAQRVMGVPMTAAEAEAAMHLWRYIGWLMGVDDRLLCDSERQGRVALAHNLAHQPPMDDAALALGRALLDEPVTQARTRRRARWNVGLPGCWAARMKGRIERAQGLGVGRLVLGRHALWALGWPVDGPTGFLRLQAWGRTLRHACWTLLPGGRRHLACAGRAAQEAALAQLMQRLHPTTARPRRPQDWGVVLSPSGLRPPAAGIGEAAAGAAAAGPIASRARSA